MSSLTKPSGSFTTRTPSRQHLSTTPCRSTRSRTPRANLTPSRRANSGKTPGDRFIPNRAATDIEFSRYKVASKGENSPPTSQTTTDERIITDRLLALKGHNSNSRILSFNQAQSITNGSTSANSTPGKYEYWSPYKTPTSSSLRKKKRRKLPKAADKVLDAPNLINDYYLNVLDWSKGGHLAIALGNAVYVLDTENGGINHLCDMDSEQLYVSSLQWNTSGKYLAVGCSDAEIQLWDVNAEKMVRRMRSHQSQVDSLSWNSKTNLLSSGSQHGAIHNYDPRLAHFHMATLKAHTMDVCGLKWSPNGRYLASGGNDNVINIWDSYSRTPWAAPTLTLKEHTAAVKALSWCPWQPSLLASGGGTADKTICLWNISNGTMECKKDVGSQVSGLVWSHTHQELLSSHGQPSNSLSLWLMDRSSGATSLSSIAELKGHEDRILHIALSPDGRTVASAAADETLRFWNCFEKSGSNNCENVGGSDSPKLGLARYIR